MTTRRQRLNYSASEVGAEIPAFEDGIACFPQTLCKHDTALPAMISFGADGLSFNRTKPLINELCVSGVLRIKSHCRFLSYVTSRQMIFAPPLFFLFAPPPRINTIPAGTTFCRRWFPNIWRLAQRLRQSTYLNLQCLRTLAELATAPEHPLHPL